MTVKEFEKKVIEKFPDLQFTFNHNWGQFTLVAKSYSNKPICVVINYSTKHGWQEEITKTAITTSRL